MKIFSNFVQAATVLITLLCLNNPLLFSQDIVINEVMFHNDTVAFDQFGETPAWVELYNRGTDAVQLDQFFLTDNQGEPNQWQLPQQELLSGAVILIYLSGRDLPDHEPAHSNFTIGKNGSAVFLLDLNGNLVDESPVGCVPANRSRGRLPNGFDDWEWLSHPSPEETNNTAYADELSLPVTEITPSHYSGFYDQPISVQLEVNGNQTVHFTLNTGATPTIESPVLPGTLPMGSRLTEENHFAEIPTTDLLNEFIPPESPIVKSHVLRAVAIAEGCPVSPVFTGNFFVGENIHYPVDVVSVNTNPENLFDPETGIYVYGNDHNYVKRGDEWERPAHIEFFSPEGESYFRQNAGLRIHGGGTREGAQKSLRLYARSEYGESWFNYPFFEDRELTQYKRLILRMTMGDWSRTLFKDELTRYLVRDLEMDYQSGLPTVVFLNGEYWGIHNLSERQDTRYLESHHDVDRDNLDQVDYSLEYLAPFASEGDLSNYNELIAYLETHDLHNDEYFEIATEHIDLDNFIDQHIAQIYFANTDYPGNNNSLWRSRSEEGKWRWLFYDCDACMMRPHYNHLVDNVVSDINLRDKPEWSMIIFRSLMQNKGFVDRFTARFRTLTNTTFSTGKVIDAINRFEETYAPLIPEHMHRWHYPDDYLEWKRNVQDLKVFALKRPLVLNELLERYFGQPFVIAPNPNAGQFRIQFIGDTEVGSVQLINSRGQVIENRHYANALQSQLEFDLTSAPAGIYLIRVLVNNRYYTQRIVIGSQPE